MLKVTKFTNKNTMLSSILSDIASRLLTKSGEEDRVANFASRVADEMEQENSATFKATPDYIKNKKIAVQLAKRYIDDYKKMQSEPGYSDQVRMDPADFSPKKDIKGKAKETEAFENWVNNVGEATIKPYVSMYKGDDGKMVYDVLDKNEKSAFKSGDMKAAQEYLKQNYDKLREYAKEPKNPEDRDAKLKALQDIQMDPNTAKDPEMVKTMIQRKKELQKTEGNEFAMAVQKANAAGMKAGDKFKVGDKEYTLKDAIEMAGLQLEQFFSEEEIEVPEEAQAEAEEINTELDRIKTLANLS